MDPPQDFHHPFTPYPIQQDFMKALYSTLDSKSVGIFESPTGTGKSLSLICGALTWLRDYKRYVLENGEDNTNGNGNEPEWVLEFERQERRVATEMRKREMEERIARVREKERKDKLAVKKGLGQVTKKRKELQEEEEEEFLLGEYNSDDEVEKPVDPKNIVGGGNLAPEVLKMLQQQMAPPAAQVNDADEPDEIKIFYASRTHSQLTQFVGELTRPHFPATYPPSSSDTSIPPHELIKHISLASRKQLCINPKVNHLTSQTALNERCLELQKKSSKSRCEYKLNPHDPLDIIKQRDFRDHALAEIRDIEDLAGMGKGMGVCPYYASRLAMKPAEIVTLPYPLLLQRSTRESLGIDITGHIVIIDEAHNIIDAISSLHSTTLTLNQLLRGKQQLEIYLGKFSSRLSGRNTLFIKQILALFRRLESFLMEKKGTLGEITAAELLVGSRGLDQINFYKVEKYLRTSGLPRKVDGYNRSQIMNDKQQDIRGSPPILMILQSFLGALNNPRREGRIFYSQEEEGMQFRYLLLDVSNVFLEIVDSARSVVLAGGTMSPLHSYINSLLPGLSREKLQIHSFGHIVPKENLCVSTLSKGPSGRELTFDFNKRDDSSTMEELGRTILGLANLVRQGGIVVFVPSYKYLDQLFKAWQNTILPKLQAKRKIFREPRSTSTEETIREYAAAIIEHSTAILFSVISGKLSEGINFSDNLCRLILLIGIPYPNPYTPEHKARQSYLQESLTLRGHSAEEARRLAAEGGEDMALRAVNQAIGRAVRHKADWACILLVDSRWEGRRVRGKLAGWIRESVDGGTGFGDVVGKVGSFFRGKRI